MSECVSATGSSEITSRASIQEHWTLSRSAVVLSGRRDQLERVAETVGVPLDDIADITTTRSTIGLWGAALERYCELAGNGPLR
ncbi:MAG: hypothetical protein ACRD1H_04230 [Vicinamibacterales bacterium]